MVRRPIRRRMGVIRFIAGWWLAANKNAMPSSCSVSNAVAPARSMSRPSASSVSAAPAFELAARLPCLATGTPQAETTRDTAVETFSVWCPSPPVPHTSTVPGGASMGSRRSRMARAASAISTEVSPRSANPIRKAAIASSEARPSRTSQNARRADSRDSGVAGSGSSASVVTRARDSEPAIRRRAGSWRAWRGHVRSRSIRGGTAHHGSAASRGGSP